MTRKPAPRRGGRGFSLIELMVVLTLLVILILVVAPDVGAQLRSAQIRNGAESIVSGLQRARSEAISRNMNVRFTIVNNLTDTCALSSTSGSWIVSLDDPTASGCDPPYDIGTAPRVIIAHDARDGNANAAVIARSATSRTTAARYVTFNGLGRPTATSGDGGLGYLEVSDATAPTAYRAFKIYLGATGGARMCDMRVPITSDDPRRCPD